MERPLLGFVLAAALGTLASGIPQADPAGYLPGRLAAIRGAMWTARLDVPYGPRPGSPDNIIAFPFYTLFGPADRQRMISAYKRRGYTHVAIGPMAGTDCYHGKYPCHDATVEGSWPADGVPSQQQWDVFLDRVQELWDAGLIPVYFAKPDRWERPEFAARFDALDALHRQDRAQRLLRVVVYPGWEPNGTPSGWTAATYVRMVRRGAEVFPRAIRFLHTSCGVEAPRATSDAVSPGGAWTGVAPYLHGWFVQSCEYVESRTPEPSPALVRDWQHTIAERVGRFRNGKEGWPRGSAWGPATPMLVVAAEYAGYTAFWNNWPEDAARQLGDAAIEAGADGYLDGGTVAVPVRR